MQYLTKTLLLTVLTVSVFSSALRRDDLAKVASEAASATSQSSTTNPSAPTAAGAKPPNKAPFFDDNTINLYKAMVPILVDRLTYTDPQFSQLVDTCMTRFRSSKAEFLTALRDFWENMRKVYDGNAQWNNNFWNNVSDSLAKFNVQDFKNVPINCTKLMKNIKQADQAKITQILGRTEFFGGFNTAVPADKAHYISSMFGSRRRLASSGAFKLMNDRSRGKGF